MVHEKSWSPAPRISGGAREIDRLGGQIVPPHNIPIVRFQRLAAQLHALGPRPTYELLREIAAGAPVLERLERCARLYPNIVRVLGADRMPPVPFTRIDGSRR
jgi:hypothetical protein